MVAGCLSAQSKLIGKRNREPVSLRIYESGARCGSERTFEKPNFGRAKR